MTNLAFLPCYGLPTGFIDISCLTDKPLILSVFTYFRFISHICEVQMFLVIDCFPPSGHQGAQLLASHGFAVSHM